MLMFNTNTFVCGLFSLCLSVVYCIGFYLWQNELCLAGLTFAFLLPGSLVQVLSFRWYRADGDTRICHNFVVHTLHLGIFKRCVRLWWLPVKVNPCHHSFLRKQEIRYFMRYELFMRMNTWSFVFVWCVRLWDCSRSEWTAPGSSQSHAQEVMQHADASALRLLEVLLMTLPQTLLQTYALTAPGFGLSSPGLSWWVLWLHTELKHIKTTFCRIKSIQPLTRLKIN